MSLHNTSSPDGRERSQTSPTVPVFLPTGTLALLCAHWLFFLYSCSSLEFSGVRYCVYGIHLHLQPTTGPCSSYNIPYSISPIPDNSWSVPTWDPSHDDHAVNRACTCGHGTCLQFMCIKDKTDMGRCRSIIGS